MEYDKERNDEIDAREEIAKVEEVESDDDDNYTTADEYDEDEKAEGEDEYGRISHEIATLNVKRGLLSPIFVLLRL